MGWRGASGTEGQQFDALFDAHYTELRRFVLRRIDNRAAAEDVLAETFAIAWRRRERMPDPALPWLFGVCQKVIANHRRSAKRRLRLINRVANSRPDVGRDPADLLAERSEIGAAFSRLSSAQREVLRLVAWDGLEAADAASVLGCTTAAFRVRLHRARNELAKHLSEAGHESSENSTPGGGQHGFQEAG
jgi:RNA polymerase sigma-70 factor (ECF subfamily)